VLAITLMFSIAVLVVAAIAMAAVILWLWWNARRASRRMHSAGRTGAAAPAQGGPTQGPGQVIEGEVLKGEWKEDPH
jgi:hypothetical protein